MECLEENKLWLPVKQENITKYLKVTKKNVFKLEMNYCFYTFS